MVLWLSVIYIMKIVELCELWQEEREREREREALELCDDCEIVQVFEEISKREWRKGKANKEKNDNLKSQQLLINEMNDLIQYRKKGRGKGP